MTDRSIDDLMAGLEKFLVGLNKLPRKDYYEKGRLVCDYDLDNAVPCLLEHIDKLEADLKKAVEALKPFGDMALAVKGKDYIMTNNTDKHYEKCKEGEWEVYDLHVSLLIVIDVLEEIAPTQLPNDTTPKE